MKKLILTAVAAIGMQLAFAQNGAITNAILFQKNGKLDKAKEEIDKAVVHEKTANSAKAWYTKGEIYNELISHPIFGNGKLVADPAKEAMAAFEKAISLDKKDGNYAKQAAEKNKALQEIVYVNALNAGVKGYQDQNFKVALDNFKKAQEYKPQDTTAYLYAASSAEQLKDYAAAKANYSKLLSLDYKRPVVYSRLYYITKEEEKNPEEAQKILQAALVAHPTYKEFVMEDLNRVVSSGQSAEAIAKLEKAIQAEPTNSNLYNVLGSLYDQTGKKDLAQATYEKALKVDPNNFDANFNLGVIYYNKAADLNKKYNAMSYAVQKKSGPQLVSEINKNFKLALPYFEGAMKSNPKDVNTLETIAKIYINLGRTKDAEAMNAKVDALRK